MRSARKRDQRPWLLTLIRGLLILALGLTAIFSPALTATNVAWGFGLFAIADGVLNLLIGWLYRPSGWGWAAVGGVIGVALGAFVIAVPPATASLVALVLAGWVTATGIVSLIVAGHQRSGARRSWSWIAICGVTATAAGVFLLLNRHVGAAMLGAVFGLTASVIGLVVLFGSYRLFRTRTRPQPLLGAAAFSSKQL